MTSATLPPRSVDVLLSGPGTALAVDLLTSQVHRLNPTAHRLLDACDGATSVHEVVSAWADASGAPAEVVRGDVRAALDRFVELGLVGVTERAVRPRRLGQADAPGDGASVGVAHPVVGHTIQFVGDRDLVALLDAHLGPGIDGAEASRRVTVRSADDGTVRFVADSEWIFLDRAALLDQLCNAINEYAFDDPTVVTLHAAAAVAPDGRRVLLPAASASGKSTLVAHLATAGWSYLGDEAIGIRTGDRALLPYPKPLALDRASRAVLGLTGTDRLLTPVRDLGPHVPVLTTTPGPLDLVVLPTFRPDAPLLTERLDPPTALTELVTNALNSVAGGQSGLDVLDSIATSVPVHRVEYGSLADVEAWLRDVPVA